MKTSRATGLATVTALVAGSVAMLAAPAVAQTASRPVVSVSAASANESVGAVTFPLALSAPAPRDLQVKAVPLPGTARPGDYQPGSVSTVIPKGATSGELRVLVPNDDVASPTAWFTLRLGGTPGASVNVRDATGTIIDDDTPVPVNLVHINDHHSNLQPASNTLNLGTSGGAFTTRFGGFPQVVSKVKELEASLPNVVKIHAGDAITGTLFYSLYKGEADAALMNEACFDIFAVGNHEFDDSDANLAAFLDTLNADPDCETAALGANVVPEVGTPLAPTTVNDYLKPYTVKEIGGQKVGFVGLVIAQKTKNSSQPLETTQFLDEVETAQRYVDELRGQGINNIVLVTHQGYENDLDLAAEVTDVDAVVGGDSHSLLGDFDAYGLPSVGPYPTITKNADGEPVCVVQAWQYSWVVGELGVTFKDGSVENCGGTPHLLVNEPFTRSNTPIVDPEKAAILATIAAAPQLTLAVPDPAAAAVLQGFADQVNELSKQVIGVAGETLCDRRVPTVPRGSAPCNVNAISQSGAQLAVNGGFSQQVVTDAFLARAFRADLALQNGGGVRISVPAGDVTIGTAYTLLPFSNTLVELDLSGQEVVNAVEDGLAFYASNPGSNSGAFPYGSHIRWSIDMTQAKGQRVTNVEVKDRDTGVWAPIDPSARYIVVTNSFLAGGGDGYTTFKTARDEGRVTDTFINYAQGFIDYVVEDLAGAPLLAPQPSEFSTQSYTP
jgi:5'-nucleotidase